MATPPPDAGDSPLAHVEFQDDEVVPIRELTDLYEAVGWTSHSNDPDALAAAVDRSDEVITARDPDGELVGLARALTDGVHLLVVADVVVHPDHRRIGIGTVLVERLLHRRARVRRVRLFSDADATSVAFHRSLGFTPLDDTLVAWQRDPA